MRELPILKGFSARYLIAGTLTALALLFLCVSCQQTSQVPTQTLSPEVMSPLRSTLELDDDIFPEGLAESLDSSIEKLSRKNATDLVFGKRRISATDYALALDYILQKLKDGEGKDDFTRELNEKFDFYGFPAENFGRIFITSYFSPVLSASRTWTAYHTQPLYRTPGDLVQVNMKTFMDRFDRFSFLEDDQKTFRKIRSFYGRVVPGRYGSSPKLIPYYSRREIDSAGKLKGKNLEIAWVDPIDAFFLQIQGSGKIKFADGEQRIIGYAASNGHDYVAIGKFLFEWIPREKMSLWAIEKHLRSISYAERMNVLYKNPSYVFFRELSGKPQTSFGTEVVDGRTVATDQFFFPRGSLGFLQFEQPVFETQSSVEPSSWEPVSRFVVNHDAGGAIKGASRIDLFWGEGKDASRHAGVIKNWGNFFCLVPKPEFLASLRENLEQ